MSAMEQQGPGSEPDLDAVGYPALVRCVNIMCPMPDVMVPEAADARAWVRLHYLSGCQQGAFVVQPQEELEAWARQQGARHWELWFDAEARLLTADVYTAEPLGATEFILEAPNSDSRGAYRVVVAASNMEDAQHLGRQVLGRARRRE